MAQLVEQDSRRKHSPGDRGLSSRVTISQKLIENISLLKSIDVSSLEPTESTPKLEILILQIFPFVIPGRDRMQVSTYVNSLSEFYGKIW